MLRNARQTGAKVIIERGAAKRERGAPGIDPIETGAPETGAPETGAPGTGAPETGAPERGTETEKEVVEEAAKIDEAAVIIRLRWIHCTACCLRLSAAKAG